MSYAPDDYLSEAAAARGRDRSLDHGASTPWHRMMLAAANRHGVWFTIQDDGRVRLSEFGSKVYITTCDTPEEAIAFIDRMPVKNARRN
jgi:hypothetical protein